LRRREGDEGNRGADVCKEGASDKKVLVLTAEELKPTRKKKRKAAETITGEECFWGGQYSITQKGTRFLLQKGSRKEALRKSRTERERREGRKAAREEKGNVRTV